jgi:predicted ATPase
MGGDSYRFAHDLVRQRVLAGMPLPRLQAYHLAVADTLERVYGRTVKQHAAEIAYHLYQAGTSAAAVRSSSFLALAARNAVAVGAFEEVLRDVESELLLLPADKTRERAEALAMRAEALFGVGRMDEATAAWTAALQRFEEVGDRKAASAVRARLQSVGGQPAAAPQAATAPPTGEGPNGTAGAAAVDPEDPAQDTSRAANGTGA